MRVEVLVDVTDDDVQNGVPGSIYHCPLGLAMRRAGLVEPLVAADYVFWGPRGQRDFFPVDDQLGAWIRAFDSGDRGVNLLRLQIRPQEAVE